MKIQGFCLLAFVLYICIVSEPSVFAQTNKSNQFLTNESPRNYDVIQYDLYVDWMNIMHSTKNEPEKRQWNGEIKIKLTPLEDNFSVVELDAVMLQINEILIDGEPSLPKYSDNILTVLVPTMNIGDTTLIQINYTYNNPYNIGFFHRNSLDKYPEGGENEIDIPIASMLSEPQNARYGMPCNDRPNDKSLVRVAATVPYGMIAASNGSLDSTAIIYKENVPYSETFYGSSKHTMPTYLMTIAASEYQLHKEKMPTSSNNNDSVDVYYYTWRDDWEGNQNYNLSRIAAATPKTMLIFSDLFGDYPFEKYGVVTVDYTLLGYKSIGMEHQTLTTVSRDGIVNHILVPEFTSFAHELAHSWFGNMVTCHTGKDVGFNEGGASGLEAIYLENIRNYVDTAAYYNHMKNYRTTYLRNKQNNFNLSLCLDDNTDAFSNTSIIYAKAAWLFHHLRMLLGDDVFTLFKQMLEQHKFGTITSQEFIDFFVQNVQNPPNNVDMKRFLQQFIYQAGHPIYNLSTNVVKVDNGYNVNVLLEQTQVADKVPAEFLMNLNIKFLDEHNNVIRSEFIINDSRQQTYSFNLDAIPTNVILDTTKALLEVNKNVLIDNISFNENYDNILIYPNPINTEQITIKFQPDNILKQQIEIVDITGKNYTVNVININNNTIIVETQNLIAGTYLIVINGSNVCKIVKL